MSGAGSPLVRLAKTLSVRWDALAAAEHDSNRRLEQLQRSLNARAVDSEERSVVAFGSLARGEWTQGSDLDWTLLIDGQANADHLIIAQEVRSAVETGFKGPGATGLFGSMAFSHDIIHRIGGEYDTNRNTSQRILLLLESKTIGSKTEAYDRVVSGVLDRYLREEANLLERWADGQKVPRFLLNDVVRFWRTMAVDFASKQRERAGEGWGIRNIKLRMSRKLIFVAGLFMCFSCRLARSERVKSAGTEQDLISSLVEQLREYVRMTPLEIVADAVLRYGVDEGVARQLFRAYDEFIQMLANTEKRKELEGLRAENALGSDVFKAARNTSYQFQDALSKIFFDNETVGPLTRMYGVF